jgi:adhesin/invasin
MTVTDASGTKATANFGLTIRPASADLILSSSSLSFALMSPATATPFSQAVGVQSSQAGQQIGYTVSLSPAVPWLEVTNGSTTPDTIQASITPAGLTLSPGDYSTAIILKCATGTCNGNTQAVSVDFKVTAGPPQLQLVTDLVSFGATATALQPMTQSVTIRNAGGGSLGIGAVTCEVAWCTAGGVPGTLAGGVSASIPITVDPSLLTGGFFRTQIDIATSAGSGAIPVTVLVSAMSTMTLAPVGNQFSMQAGGAPGKAGGSFLVDVTNGSAVNWSASVLPGAPWLTLGTAGGTSSASSPGSVSYAIDPVGAAALAPGVYYGQIAVSSSGTVNSPLNFEVVLSVSPVTTAVIPDPEPAGLLFITSVGGSAAPQLITVYSGSTVATGFQASATTNNGGSWLAVSPNIGSAGSASPGSSSVTVNTAGLNAGIYTGGVSYSLSATAVRVVNVTMIVTPTGSSPGPQVTSNPAPRLASSSKASGTCAPSVLVPVQTGLVNNFSAAVAWPTPLTVVLANDCGSLVNSGQVVATFSNGDAPLPLSLADPAKGLYSGTWTPRKSVGQMTVIAHATAAGYPEASVQVVGAATPNSAPVLTPHGTLHSFDPLVGAALAPGTIIQIYGQNLASETSQPNTIPLPTTMNGTSVIVGGIPAPLYYVSPGQINAQLPFELSPGNQYQVLISANGALTTPDMVQLSAATPGLAAFADSTLIAQHGDGSLVSTNSPARPGEYLVAYLAGMGETNATPASGAASPGSPLALPSVTPVLTLNGSVYPIAFAGLTPGLVGLYQMNFQVPAGLPAGDLTLRVTQNGQLSNQTVLPYQP